MTNAQTIEQAKELRSNDSVEQNEMHDYFQDVCSRIDDTFYLGNYDLDQTSNVLCIHFDKILEHSRDYVKFYIYDLLHEKHSSPKTANGHAIMLRTFIEYFDTEHHILNMGSVDEHEYKAFVDKLINDIKNMDLKMKTAYSYATVAKDFFACLEDNGLAEYNFLAKYDLPKIFPINKPDAYYSEDQKKQFKEETRKKKEGKHIPYPDLIKIMSFIDHIDNPYLKAAIIILSHTGLRLKELLNLKIDCMEKESSDIQAMHFDAKQEDGNIYWLSRYKYSKVKKKHWRDGTPILVPKIVYDAVNELIEHTADFRHDSGEEWDKYLFLTKKRGGGMFDYGIITDSHIRGKMTDYAKDIGVKKFTPHQFRYTFAKILYGKQIPLDYIKKYLNHISEDMSAMYIANEKNKNMSKYSDFMEMDIIEGHAKDDAIAYQNRLKKASANETFQGMSAKTQVEILDMISLDMGMSINIMDHGLCFLPEGTSCPNNFTEVNSCIDSHCSKFGTTERSIPFLENIISYKKDSIEDLVQRGFTESANYNQKKLNKTIDIFNNLRRDKSEKA